MALYKKARKYSKIEIPMDFCFIIKKIANKIYQDYSSSQSKSFTAYKPPDTFNTSKKPQNFSTVVYGLYTHLHYT